MCWEIAMCREKKYNQPASSYNGVVLLLLFSSSSLTFFSAALYTTNNKQKQQQQMNMTVRWWWCILCKYIHIHTFFACTFHQQELNSTAATLNPHKLNQYNKWKGRRRRGKHQQCTQVHGEIVVTEGIMNNMLRDKVMK